MTEKHQARARNVVTGQERSIEVSQEHLESVLLHGNDDTCTGECECPVEPDGECPYGWPSKSRAVGII